MKPTVVADWRNERATEKIDFKPKCFPSDTWMKRESQSTDLIHSSIIQQSEHLYSSVKEKADILEISSFPFLLRVK